MRLFVSILFALLLAGCLSGCGALTNVTSPLIGVTGAVTGPAAQRTVYAVNAAYIAALEVAVSYESKPRCSATVTTACSDTAIVTQMRKANATAKAAIDAAETAVRTPSLGDGIIAQAMQAAQIALAAFSALTSLPGVKS